MKLTAKARAAMPKNTFALPEKRAFPLNDANHARAAITGAARAYNAGNINAAAKSEIVRKAKAKLGKGK